MGVVYQGVDLVMQRSVAVKLVRTRDGVRIDEAITGRFLREAKHTARIQHENIVDVFDLGRGEDGDLFFVMELLSGQTLSQLLQAQERLEPELATHVGAQIADALDAAHRGGIVHRDLKPANVMLMQRGQDPAFVKVLDFGVAKAHAAGEAETALTRTGVLVGTIEYMAPEQILGRKVDGRTDIYSLGVLLYRSITGSNPFRDALMPAMIHNHLNVMPEPMQSRLPSTVVSLALERVVEKCMQKDPNDRYASMSDVARALRASLRPDPTADLPELGASNELEGADADDPYEDGFGADDAKTRVQRRGTAVTMVRKPRPATEKTRDATQVTALTKPGPAPEVLTPVPPEPIVANGPLDAGLPVLQASDEHDDLSALMTQVEPARICAMCSTPNLRTAIHCAACGVGLHTVEQAAVRARVTAGERDATKRIVTRPAPTPFPSVPAPWLGPGPSVPPPTPPMQQPSAPSPPLQAQGAQPFFQASLPHPPNPHTSVEHPHTSVEPQAPHQPALEGESMWSRMLRWAGLKRH
jgi:serine/threonine-protein kinase